MSGRERGHPGGLTCCRWRFPREAGSPRGGIGDDRRGPLVATCRSAPSRPGSRRTPTGCRSGWSATCCPGLGLATDDAAPQRLAHASVARYAGRLYPGATEADLRALTALFTWFFLVDDACDRPGRLDADQIRALRAGALTLLHAGPRLRHAGLTGPLRRLLVHAWREPRRRMPARWRLRFAEAVADHLDGTWREAANKAAGRRPGIAEYVALRRATSAAYVSYPLVEFVTGRPLPDPVHHHPLLREIADTGNDLLSWYNDLASLERDEATSGGHNLVLATAAEQRVPVETRSA